MALRCATACFGIPTPPLAGSAGWFNAHLRGCPVGLSRLLSSVLLVVLATPDIVTAQQAPSAFHKPKGVAIPEGECACSYELPQIDGEMICPPLSPYLEKSNRRDCVANSGRQTGVTRGPLKTYAAIPKIV